MSQAIGIDAPGLQFGMLGTLQVTRSGKPLPLGGRQQRAVLASLLVEADTVVSLRRLADALWGEHTPPSAVITVQTYISRLREILEPERVRGAPATVLITVPGGYRLRLDGAGLDAATFEQRVRAGRAALEAGRNAEAASELDEAVGLWRGPVLADLTDFDFVREAADRLDELRLGALEARADAELALGRHREVLTDLDQLITAHPLRERFRAQQMLALYRCGRQSEALASYQQMRTTLADELGIDPSPPLQQLHQAILRQDPELDWQPAAIEPAKAAVVDQAGHAGIHRRRRWLVAGIAAGVAVLLVTGTWVAVRHLSSGRTLSALPPNSVGRLDRHGVLRAGVTVAPTPNGLAYGAGSLWATSTADGSVSRIDPRTQNVLETIPVGAEPNAIAVAGNDVWVANGGDGSVSRINAQNNRVVDTVTGLGDGPDAIAAGAGGIWVALAGDDAVRRIDPRTDRPGPAILVGGQPDGIGIGRDTVWVANGADGTVSRIDATTGQANSPIFVGAGPKGIAVTPTAVWVTNSLDLTVSRIDPATGKVNLTTPVGDGPHSVVAGPSAVWVSDEYDGTIIKIDPRTGRAIARIQTGSSPRGLAMVGADVWVASGALANRAHRGGTLTIETTPDALPGAAGIDPAAVFDHASFWLQHLMYDGLVGLRRASGADGVTLVPDLATALPRPTDGGRTYAFTLRSGIHYSTGELVRPADIARGVRRALAPTATSSSYFAGIVGAQQCIDHPASCDLSQGVVTDNSSVIFHLTAPDPDFLYKLTNFVWATAPHTPIGLARTPLPATGPYIISGYTAKEKQFTLIRNRQFHQWSFAAQPDGYPNVIRWRSVSNGSTRIADVLADRADLVDLRLNGPAPESVDELAHRYPTRLHSGYAMVDTYEFLNTHLAPFNDIRVRHALNYAVDRRQLVALSGGNTQAKPSCQIDPPNFPGYRPYCLYTVDPSPDGSYHGPDLARARRLIAASGTAGMPVTVWSVDYPFVQAISQYYVTLLRRLGYRVNRHEAPVCCYFPQVGDPRNRAQIGWGLWQPDFPAPSDFYGPVLSCGSANLSNYCSKHAEALATRARASEQTDPGAARQLWAAVDRVATNDAPWISETSAIQSELTSSRVGNEQDNPLLGPLLDQMWVR